jgi:hypothetical protein
MKRKLYLSLTALAIFGSASYAGTMGEIQTNSLRGGWIIGGDVGYGYLSTTEPYLLPVSPTVAEPPLTSRDVQRRKIGSLVGGGYAGYDFHVSERLLMGLEVGYKYLDRSKYHTISNDFLSGVFATKFVKVNQQAVDFLLTGKFFLSPHINLIGKAGAAYVRSKTTENSVVNIVNDFGSLSVAPVIWRIRPEFDLGVGFSFYSNLSLNLIYTHIGGADANVTGLYRFYNVGPDSTPAVFQYNALTAGLSYSFS